MGSPPRHQPGSRTESGCGDRIDDHYTLMILRGNLQFAHQGYLYQDLATAYVLVRSLTERYDRVVADRKQVADDRVDDLEIVAHGVRVRRQFKSSENPNRSLSTADFMRANSTLRIDRLVLTYIRAGESPASEYRLCATWQPPKRDDALTDLLDPIEGSPTINSWPSRCFRLHGERLWPTEGPPLWKRLASDTHDGSEFGRRQFLAFCQRFVIELALPRTSGDLRRPGPLERAVIDELSQRIGIGRYPNHDRRATDVAALATSLATLARGREAGLTPSDVERALDIRTDFGRVAQAFPFDATVFCNRPFFRARLRQLALSGSHQVVIGAPGTGKSWELTQLASELREDGAIVARHYCYLEPGDTLVEERVTTNVFFGNIIADLTDAAPALIGAARTRYAAGLTELEETLRHAVTLARPVVLIVDGLDHISRVRAGSAVLAPDHTDIVQHLATLQLPDGVALVVGSQPGDHLDDLRTRWGAALVEQQIPRWPTQDIEALALRHGVRNALTTAAILEEHQITEVLVLLCERADGSPLLARYLARGLVEGLRDGTIDNPADWLVDIPVVDGDIAVYYEYLYRTASQEAQAIADILGVIDFSVSEGDLREILPAFVGDWVPEAVRRLRPVLEMATAQGGMRIFHESFRRYMNAEQSRHGRSIRATLAPVITWLEGRDFFCDAKSYRFLLPALRRAGRSEDVVARIGAAFVSDSVAHAHSREGIERNIALAADVAARDRDWIVLARCSELQRSNHTCFANFSDVEDQYWPTYLELFGAEALAERLLFDGRPTRPPDEGLLVCSLIDDAGGTPPWKEYLELWRPRRDAAAAPDREDGLTRDERVNLAAAHGYLRTGGGRRILRRLYRYLTERGDGFRRLFVQAVASRFARVGSAATIGRLASRGDPEAGGGRRISARASSVLRLGLADEFARRRDARVAAQWATEAARTADTPALGLSAMLHGAATEVVRTAATDPSTMAIAIDTEQFLGDGSGVRNWVASVRLLATDRHAWPAIAERERERTAGEGWYRCWLGFVLNLASAAAGPPDGVTARLEEAFAELSRDTRPFAGQPRACDLYPIWGVIAETVGWALTLVRTPDEWRLALDTITRTARETRSRLDTEDAGPISTATLFDLLIPYARDLVAGPMVRRIFEDEVERRNHDGTYYSTHAKLEMCLARVRSRNGDTARALASWRRAAVFVPAYGFHKDIAIFDLVESAPSLSVASVASGLTALADIQPLTVAALAHTDGRETRHAPNAWFRGLIGVDQGIATTLLAQTAVAQDGTGGWPTAEAVRDLTNELAESADPVLLDAVARTVRLDASSEHDASRNAETYLRPIARLVTLDRPRAEQVFRRVLAEIEDNSGRYGNVAAKCGHALAERLGFDVPIEPHDDTRQSDGGAERPVVPYKPPPHVVRQQPEFPPNPTLVDLLKGLRAAGQRRRGVNSENWNGVVTALTYRLGELVDAGHENDAERVLRFFARDVHVSSASAGDAHPLACLAEAFETVGCRRMAALAYTLAYSAARGGSGWLHLGDSSHAYLISRAMIIDPEVTQTVLAQEIGYALRVSHYTAGTARHLIERLAGWGDVALAERAWQEAYAVLAHRLPLAPQRGWFAGLDVASLPEWTDGQALVALALARLSEPRLRLKLAALGGVVHAIQCTPDVAAEPIRWWLGHSRPSSTSIILVLAALVACEVAPWSITRAASVVLNKIVRGMSWGARRFALELLRRAALPTPPVPPDLPTALPADTGFTGERRDELRAYDVGDDIGKVATFGAELSDPVLRRLHGLLQDDPENRERSTERKRLMWSRRERAFPPIPVLLWETELFVGALHTELNGLSVRLLEAGRWTPGIEGSVAAAITPDMRVHLGLAASRTVRPPWAFSDSIQAGVGPVTVLRADDDPAYQQWVRLGIVEREYVSDAQHLQEAFLRLEGVVALPLGENTPDNALPFEDGDPQDWWSEPPAAGSPGYLPLGRLVRLHRRTDWLGDALVLIPPLLLRTYAGLQAPPYGAPFVWHDADGAPMVVLRTWRVMNIEAVGTEAVLSCEGSDLIASPVVIERLQLFLGVGLQEVTAVLRTNQRNAEE